MVSPCRVRRERTERDGFTVVELLITITIFAIAMAALLTGLRSGVHTWRTVRAHQVRVAEDRRAIERMAQDLRHVMPVKKDTPPVVGVKGENGFDTMTVSALSPHDAQSANNAAKGNWATVTYQAVKNDVSKGMDLVRTTQVMVAESTRGDKVDECLLPGVSAVSFEYLTSDGAADAWSDATRPPPFVRATIRQTNGASVTETFWIPAGSVVGAAS